MCRSRETLENESSKTEKGDPPSNSADQSNADAEIEAFAQEEAARETLKKKNALAESEKLVKEEEQMVKEEGEENVNV